MVFWSWWTALVTKTKSKGSGAVGTPNDIGRTSLKAASKGTSETTASKGVSASNFKSTSTVCGQKNWKNISSTFDCRRSSKRISGFGGFSTIVKDLRRSLVIVDTNRRFLVIFHNFSAIVDGRDSRRRSSAIVNACRRPSKIDDCRRRPSTIVDYR